MDAGGGVLAVDPNCLRDLTPASASQASITKFILSRKFFQSGDSSVVASSSEQYRASASVKPSRNFCAPIDSEEELNTGPEILMRQPPSCLRLMVKRVSDVVVKSRFVASETTKLLVVSDEFIDCSLGVGGSLATSERL